MKTSILFLLTCSLVTACIQEKGETSVLPYYREATFMPYWFASADSVPADFHKIKAFKLLNQEGQVITEQDLNEKIVVADFFFTSCPGICREMTENMGIVQKAFESDDEVQLLSYSVTPKIDSVDRLKRYATEKGVANGKWHLLTGDQSQIYDLGRKAFFVEEDLGLTKKNTDFLHTENFVLLDQNRYIRGIYNGLNKASINQLIEDIKALKEQ